MPHTPWEWENPICERSLTGRIRPRVLSRAFRSPLILMQVEEKLTHRNMFDESKAVERTIWRDATISDLSIREYIIGTSSS